MDDAKKYEELQDDEFVVLKSIYGDDVRDLRTADVWKVRRPPELDIRLLPLHSSSSSGGGRSDAEAEPHALVHMHVKCPARYPDMPPSVELTTVKGLSAGDAAALLAELRSLASQSVGEVMLFGLAQHAQAFLHAHSKPPSSSFYDEMLSRRRQQEEREREEQLRREQALLQQHEQERLEIEGEIRERQEAAREARLRRDEVRKSESAAVVHGSTTNAVKEDAAAKRPLADRPDGRREQEMVTGAGGGGPGNGRRPRQFALTMPDEATADSGRPGSTCKRHASSASLTFASKTQPRTVHRGQCIGHGTDCVTYSAIDATTGELCAVTEWVLPFQTFGKKLDADQKRDLDNEMAKYFKQVAAAEQELTSLLKLRCHGLLHYLAIQYQKVDASIVIQVLREHCCGWSLDMYLRQLQPVDLPLLKKYASELVDTLLYLHGNAVAHKALRADVVYVDESGDLRLADYSLSRRLNDLRASMVSISPQQQSAAASAAAPTGAATTGKRWQKEDVYQLGMLLLSLWNGDEVQLKDTLVDGPAALPATLPADLRDFLAKCLHADDRQRWPAAELKEHSFLRTAITHHQFAAAAATHEPVEGDVAKRCAAVAADKVVRRRRYDSPRWHDDEGRQLDDVPFGFVGDDGGELYELHRQQQQREALAAAGLGGDAAGGGGGSWAVFPSGTASCQTRLTTEFDVLELLGKGGFGAVLKVRNKLDGRLYAIKRIPLSVKGGEHLNKKITREVKLLSRLNHENVVRYYNSWLEVSYDHVESGDSSSCYAAAASSSEKPPPPADRVGREIAKRTARNQAAAAQLRLAAPLAAGSEGRSLPLELNSIGLPNDMDVELMAAANVAELEEDSGSWASGPEEATSNRSRSSSVSSSPEEEGSVFGIYSWPFHVQKDDTESDSIIAFDHNSQPDDSESNSLSEAATDKDQQIASSSLSSGSGYRKVQYMCIQMEFCEKSTLRNCIDMGLHEDVDRVWRLFREIIEGLVHIHEQGMIHRDLKPVNIFLDSNDHVKIGDFGLATTEVLGWTARTAQRQGELDTSLTTSQQASSSGGPAGVSLGGDTGGHTGQVGTALYVAPEILSCCGKTSYSQKVDIYSLGVIFFEMCYKSLPTAMQRMCILSDLRRSEVILPDDFAADRKMEKQAAIVRWLLDHDPSKRPSAAGLLQSSLLPPPLVEESELQEIVRSTVANPQSRGYKKLMTALFQQPVPRKFEVGYDEYLQRGVALKVCRTQEHVKDIIAQIFRNHGAVTINIPLLLPKLAVYEYNEAQVCLMDYAGGLVSLPFDLRVPFARFVARSHVTSIKRYAVERVYRETRPHGMHPREHWECAFDIIMPSMPSVDGTSAVSSRGRTSAAAGAQTSAEPPTGAVVTGRSPDVASSAPQASTLVPDAEVVLVVAEVIDRFPALADRTYICHINHIYLLRAVLLHAGVPSALLSSAVQALSSAGSSTEAKMGFDGKKALFRSALANLKLSAQALTEIPELLSIEGVFSEVSSKMKKITKVKNEASSFAKRGLHELEVVVSCLESLGTKLKFRINVGLLYAAQYSSGIMFQVTTTSMNSKHRNQIEVFAAGYRYDALIDIFRLPWSKAEEVQSGVGVSIAFDHIVACFLAKKEVTLPGHVEVLLCAPGKKAYMTEQLNLAKDLWASGIKADVLCDAGMLFQDVEAVHEHCREQRISCLVVFKESEAPGFVRVRSFEKDKVNDRRVPLTEAAEVVTQVLARSESHDGQTALASKSGQVASLASGDSGLQQQQQQQTAGGGGGSGGVTAALHGGSSGGGASGSVVNLASIVYVPADEKLNLKDKKKAEAQVSSRLQGSGGAPAPLVTLSKSYHVHVVAAEVNSEVVRTVASFLEVHGTPQAFLESQEDVFSRLKRYKKYLERIFDKIHELRFQRKGCLVALYGLKDDSYRLLL